MQIARNSLAVVDDQTFYTGARTWEHEPIAGLRELLDIADMHNLTHVWIRPGTKLSKDCGDVRADLADWNTSATYRGGKTQDIYSYVSARLESKRHEDRIQIGLTENSRWPWKNGGNDPRVILATVSQLEKEFGLPVEWTPAHLTMEYIRLLLQKKQTWHWLRPMTRLEEIEQDVKMTKTCRELTWTGNLTGNGRHLIKIDANSAYAAVMPGLNVGEGDPLVASGETAGRVYDGKKPGFWKVRIDTKQSLWNGEMLPAIKQEWMTTDLINQLRQSGYEIEILAGWYWPNYHQTLRCVASELWEKRVAWRNICKQKPDSCTARNVYDTISTCVKSIHGKLGDPDTSQKHFQRRDVWALVVAGSVARMIYRIDHIRKIYGLLPSKIDKDAAWYEISSPDVLATMLSEDRLGGFKEEYCIDLTQDIRQHWHELRPGQLNRLAGKEEYE